MFDFLIVTIFMSGFQFTSESVTCGHPDKICDQISDAILDEALRHDPHSRVAVETAVKTGMVMCFGEMRTQSWVDVEKLAREVVRDIGYTNAAFGFDSESIAVLSAIGNQSAEIAHGVDGKNNMESIGAGDQGMMFGFACEETDELMPLPISLAHRLTRQLEKTRRDSSCDFLRPDGKSQVTVEYSAPNEPKRVSAVVLSAQHHPEIALGDLQTELKQKVILPILGELVDDETIFHINPTGSFVVGGPQGDAGLTGRKIIVDTYGGYCAHGGGAFSGKDPTKVDRTGAYAARHIAKNIVAAKLAKVCEVQISYAIGVAEPVSIFVNTRGTGVLTDSALEKIVVKLWDLRPGMLIQEFGLQEPIFQTTATGGHFGRSAFAWEKLDKVSALQKAI